MLLSFPFEDFDKSHPNDFAFFFRVFDARKTLDELVSRIYHDQIQTTFVFLHERCLDFLSFVFSQQPIINKDAHKLFADGLA